MDSEIIFTTAFKDINREKWISYQVSTGRYIDYFIYLAKNIKYTLIVYLEKEIKDLIFKKTSLNENIIFRELNEVNTFLNQFLEKDKEIINSDIYKQKVPEYRKKLPEHLYSDYNLINHSKINFVNKTKQLYPNYLYYAWIDFGRMNGELDNIPQNLDISLLPKNKITYHFVNDPPKNRISEENMLRSNEVHLLGSSFILPNRMVEIFEILWKNKLIDWQKEYITDDDQNLVLQLYFDNPYMFYGIKNDKWYNMYKNLQFKTIIPKIILQTSVNKPEQYVIDKIMSKCNNYTYIHFTNDEIIEFFKNNYIEEFKNVIEKFHSIKSGAHKATLFRYYFLYLNGGIFLDSDAMIEMNIYELINDESFFSVSSHHHQCDKIVFCGFIGAEPKNEIIYKALQDVYNISINMLDFHHMLYRNLFLIMNEKKYDFKIKLFQQETWEEFCEGQCNYAKSRNENNDIVLKHYCFDKKIPMY